MTNKFYKFKFWCDCYGEADDALFKSEGYFIYHGYDAMEISCVMITREDSNKFKNSRILNDAKRIHN